MKIILQYAPSTAQASLIVGIRVRPLLASELAKGGRRDIIRVIDSKVVVVLDPDESKASSCSAAGMADDGLGISPPPSTRCSCGRTISTTYHCHVDISTPFNHCHVDISTPFNPLFLR